MRRPIAVLGAIGVVLLAAAGLWLLIAPGTFVKYPDDLNKTAVAKGTVTLYVDPATGAPAATPTRLPLAIQRNLRVVESTGSQATVQETSTEQIGPQAAGKMMQSYVIDRGSLENIADPHAYAYTPTNVTNRSGAYSINLPFATGDGPYQLWKNETAGSYAFSRSGEDIERHGLTLKPMTGRLEGARVTQAYLDQLASQGIRKEIKLGELAPQLGLDAEALAQQLAPELSSADRAALQAMLAAPVPINYFISVETRLLVEPTTGAIVSLDRIEQTMSALPDLSNLAGLGTLLSKAEYSDSEVVQGTLTTVKGLTGALPVAVMKLEYGQTPASVADIASYTRDKADAIRLVKTLIPLTLAISGVIFLLGAAAVATASRSRTRAKVAA
jgi:hypothetical protein